VKSLASAGLFAFNDYYRIVLCMTTYDFSTTKGTASAVTLNGLHYAQFGSVYVQFSSTSAYADDLIPQKSFSGNNDFPITLSLTANEVDRIRDAHFQVIGFNLVNNQPVYTPGILTGRIDYQIPAATSGGGGLTEDDVNTLINNALAANNVSGGGGAVPTVLLQDESRHYQFNGGDYLSIYRYVTKRDMVNGDEEVVSIGWANELTANPTTGNVEFYVQVGTGLAQIVDSTLTPAMLNGIGPFTLSIDSVTATGFQVYIDPQTAVPAGTVIEFWSSTT
jgi:hypothetical protein